MKQFIEAIRKHPKTTAVIAYVILVVVFTYPLIFRMTSEFPKGGRDSFMVYSSIERLSGTVRDLGWREGFIELAKTYQLNTYLPYVVLGQFTDVYGANNVMFLLSYLLSAVGGYLLALYFTKDHGASFVAGLIFAFSPYHTYQATAIHVGSMHQELLPFFVLFLFRFFERFQLRYFLLLALFSFLIALTEHQLLAVTVIFLIFFVAYAACTRKGILRDRRLWAYAAVSALLLGVFAIVLFKPLLNVALSDRNYLDPGLKSVKNLSTQAIDVILPPQFHGIWPDLNDLMQRNLFHSSRKGDSYYLGFSVIAACAFVVYRHFGHVRRSEAKEDTDSGDVGFWIFATAVFFVISLGPTADVFHVSMYLPYYLIYKFIPFYDNIRTVGRFLVFAVLGASVLSAYAVVALRGSLGSKAIGRRVAVIFGVIVMLEYWIAPLQTVSVSYSPYYNRIARDGSTDKLLEIPGSTNDVFFNYEWITRNVHNKELVNGMAVAREIDGQFDMQEQTPVIRELLYTIPKGGDPDRPSASDIVEPFDFSLSNQVLTLYKVGYITISKQYVSADVLALAESFIEKHIATTDRYEDDYLVAYRVAQVKPQGLYLELSGNGYSKTFSEDGTTYRMAGDDAGVRITNLSDADRRVRVTVDMKDSGQELRFSANGPSDQGPVERVGSDIVRYEFVTTVPSGTNDMNFSVTDSDGNPVSMSNAKGKPRRGVMISSIRLTDETSTP